MSRPRGRAAELAASPLGAPSPGRRPGHRRRARRAGRGLGGLPARPGPGAGRPPDRGRHGDARRLPPAAAQPAPAGRGRRPVDLAGRRELLGRAVLAAQRGHPARRRRAPRLPAARTRLRGGRGRPARSWRRPRPTSARRAVGVRLPPGRAARPGRPARRDVRDRGPGHAEGRPAGRTGCRPTSGLADDQVSFLRYHATGDDEHFEVLRGALRSGACRRRRAWRGSSRPPGWSRACTPCSSRNSTMSDAGLSLWELSWPSIRRCRWTGPPCGW